MEPRPTSIFPSSPNVRARVAGAGARIALPWVRLVLALSALACLAAACADDEKPCDPGTRRACETAAGAPGSRLCGTSQRWSDTCEPTVTHCDPDECARYGLCRLTDVVLAANLHGSAMPSLAVGDNALGCAWRGDASPGTSLWFGRFTPEGYHIGDPKFLGDFEFVYAYPEVVYNEGRYLVTWEKIGGAQILSSGYAVLDGSAKVVGTDEYWQERTRMHPAPAEDGFFVAFLADWIRAQHIDRDGQAATETIQLVSTNSLGNRPEIHDYAWADGQHVVLLHDRRDGFHLRRFSGRDRSRS
jgi:hypothetical protein